MAVYEGTVKALSGDSHQRSPYSASYSDWKRLEFVTIDETRLKEVRMLTMHYELLKTEVGKDVSLSLLQGTFRDVRKDQWTLAAVRLSDGSVEKIPDEFSNIYVIGSAQMFLMTLLLLGVAAVAFVLNITLVAIGALALGLFIGLSLMRSRGQAARMHAQIRGAIHALDGSAAPARR